MELVLGLVLIGLCAALVRYARPGADGVSRPPFASDGAASVAILVVTVLGSLGVMLIAFQATGIAFGG
ncbi:MAG: hypothetical protein ACK4U0_19700 [Mesorhizobium sp.]